jgi:hypothetical protein
MLYFRGIAAREEVDTWDCDHEFVLITGTGCLNRDGTGNYPREMETEKAEGNGD